MAKRTSTRVKVPGRRGGNAQGVAPDTAAAEAKGQGPQGQETQVKARGCPKGPITLAKDIGAVASLVRERGYGTERDKPAMLARLDGWQTAALDIADALAAASAPVPAGTCATCRFGQASSAYPQWVQCSRCVRTNAAPSGAYNDKSFGCTLHEPAAHVRGTQE